MLSVSYQDWVLMLGVKGEKFVMIRQREEGDTKGEGLLFRRIGLRSLWSFKGGGWKEND